jgi:hypothetical protein
MAKKGRAVHRCKKIKNEVDERKVREETIFVAVPEEIRRPTYLA